MVARAVIAFSRLPYGEAFAILSGKLLLLPWDVLLPKLACETVLKRTRFWKRLLGNNLDLRSGPCRLRPSL